ncbi:segregation/condensation protein A [soil metagenome]
MEENYRVKLEIFEGPLDLLLYLIKRDEVDIYDISVERITKQYLEYMGTFKMLNIDLASEFIVMAANLMYIKSRMLLPKAVQPPDEEAEEDDPRWELIRQLIEYKKFKDAAGYLQLRAMEQERVYAATPELPDAPPENAEPSALPNVGIFDLIRAFQKVLNRFEKKADLGEIYDDRFTVGDKIEFLLEMVAPGGQVQFSALFEEATTRDEVIVTFVALLELMKIRQFRIEQESMLGEILLIRSELS